ncbi:hypothetical protein C8N29_1485 [Agitococcus lubricus]|uniref:DUF6985 domain-containing protein n=2 Tax=Agitococcus lubricus TaxID=1077255 RepID=A0A2T5IPZ6_9GAMM|nr:hypothetical protein C8N29_1485 [Agitococcus lubricus]
MRLVRQMKKVGEIGNQMSDELKFEDGSWTVKKYLPFIKQMIEVSIFTDDNPDNKPSSRQLEVFGELEKIALIIDDLNNYARKYLMQIEELRDLEEENIYIDASKIDHHYKLKTVLIGSLEECSGRYFFIIGDCDWDEEHGIEFLFDGNKILSCGAAEGKFIYADSDEDYRRIR